MIDPDRDLIPNWKKLTSGPSDRSIIYRLFLMLLDCAMVMSVILGILTTITGFYGWFICGKPVKWNGVETQEIGKKIAAIVICVFFCVVGVVYFKYIEPRLKKVGK